MRKQMHTYNIIHIHSRTPLASCWNCEKPSVCMDMDQLRGLLVAAGDDKIIRVSHSLSREYI